MNWSVVILLLATVTDCDGLSCITSEQHWKKVPFTGLDYGHFMQELKNLTISEYILDGPCRVEIALNYYDEVFTIAFTKELGGSKLQLGLVRFDTFVVPVYDDEFYIENYLEYACSKGGCEIDFIKDHLPWLLGTSYPTLADNAVPLITRGTDGSDQCFNGTFEAEDCDTGMCYLSIYEFNSGENTMSSCANVDELQSGLLSLVYFINLNDLTKKYDHELYCDFDECNHPETAEKLTTIIKTHHDITALLEVLSFSDESEEKETTISITTEPTPPTLTSTSTSTTRSSTTKSRSSSISTTSRTNTNDVGRTSAFKNGDASHGPIKAFTYALHLLLAIHLL